MNNIEKNVKDIVKTIYGFDENIGNQKEYLRLTFIIIYFLWHKIDVILMNSVCYCI